MTAEQPLYQTSRPTTDKWGADVHPAFGMIGASRVSNAPGVVLFDSDIKHQHSVVLRISTASRKRDNNHDWIHSGKEIIEVEMSEAQWASFVSSMNTSGVPCTIRYTPDNWFVDRLPFSPRLRESMFETHTAAERAFGEILEAFRVYEETPNTPAKAKQAALRTLRACIDNAVPNVDFATKTMAEHVENVVTKARADVEAMVLHEVQRLGLDPGAIGITLELDAGERIEEEVDE